MIYFSQHNFKALTINIVKFVHILKENQHYGFIFFHNTVYLLVSIYFEIANLFERINFCYQKIYFVNH
jgi:hypothetical protein